MGDFEEHIAKTGAAPAKTRAPQPKASARTLVRSDVVRTSLLNAQHWLDKGTAAFKKGHPPPDRQQLLGLALVHAYEAQTTLGKGTEIERARVVPQLEQTTQALLELDDVAFNYHQEHDPQARPKFESAMNKIRTSLAIQSFTLDLDPAPKLEPHARADKDNDTYEAMALTPVLELVRLDSEAALQQLRASKGGHFERVQQISGSLLQQARHGAKLTELYARNDEAKRFGAEINAASHAVLNLWRWMFGRQNHKAMLDAFLPVMAQVDIIRTSAHFGPIRDLTPTDAPAGQLIEEKAGERDLAAAQSKFEAVLAHLVTGTEQGAEKFRELGQLHDPPEPGSLWKELAKGILIGVVGNLIGPGVGAVVARLSSMAGKAIGEGAKSMVAGSATDIAQAWAGTTFDAAATTSRSENDKIRDAMLFKNHLVMSQSAAVMAAKTKNAARINEVSITSADVMAMTVELERHAVGIVDRTYNEACRGFALLLAQRALGAGSNKVTRIGTGDEYFGVPRETIEDLPRIGDRIGLPSGLPPKRIDGKSGAPGVAKLVVGVDRSNQFEVKGVSISGMNQDMASAVVDRAGFHIDRLGLPTEIEFDVSWAMTTIGPVQIKRELPKIVVDETGALRASIAWELFTEVPSIVEPFATPEKAWATVRKESIPFKLFPKLVEAKR